LVPQAKVHYNCPKTPFLASYLEYDIGRWDRNQCRAQLRVIEIKNAQNIFEIECKQRMKGQRVITDFFNKESKET